MLFTKTGWTQLYHPTAISCLGDNGYDGGGAGQAPFFGGRAGGRALHANEEFETQRTQRSQRKSRGPCPCEFSAFSAPSNAARLQCADVFGCRDNDRSYIE
jgi:hypothetical protein